jgi:hypothetical protein
MSRTTFSPRERPPLVTDAIAPSLRRRGVAPRQMLAACVAGAMVLALFASRDTPGWAERLGDSGLDHALRDIAGGWDRAMEQLDLIRPHEELRAAMNRALDLTWPKRGR